MRQLLVAFGLLAVTGTLVGAIYAFGALDQAQRLSKEELRSATAVAMEAVSFSQEMNERLGAPIAKGEVSLQKLEPNQADGYDATVRIDLSGPKMSGHAVASLSRGGVPGAWVFVNGTFFPKAGPPIRLSRQRPAP